MASHFIESLKETLKQFKDEHQTLGKAVHDMETMLAGMLTGVVKKRRGRPPGVTAAAAEPKKRGRPPGKATLGKKRRGRPPGSKNASTLAKEAAAKATATKKKPGGRNWTPEQRQAAAERLAKARAIKKAGSAHRE